MSYPASTPAENTIDGLRDRAILSVGLQVGLRRAEIAALKVGDLHQNRGYDFLRITRKGGRRDALAIHPKTAQRIRRYLEEAGHVSDLEGPMFRPLSHNRKMQEARRGMHSGESGKNRAELSRGVAADVVWTVVKQYAKRVGVDHLAPHHADY